MSTQYEERIISLMIVPKGEPVFSEQATEIRIKDESGGEFVSVIQDVGEVGFDAKEWPAIRAGIDKMIGFCRSERSTGG